MIKYMTPNNNKKNPLHPKTPKQQSFLICSAHNHQSNHNTFLILAKEVEGLGTL